MTTTHTQVEEILSKHGISYAVTYSGESAEKENGKEWKHDRWNVTIGCRTVFSVPFKTGTGLRKMGKSGRMAPQFPKAADVLYCLLMDADALDHSFSDWCSCYGYDEDSRKAERIYFECCENGKNVRNCFSREVIQELLEALQDF